MSFPTPIHTCEYFPFFFPFQQKAISLLYIPLLINSPSVQTQNLQLFQVRLAINSGFFLTCEFIIHTHKLLDRLPHDKVTLVKESNISSVQPFVDAPSL